MPKKYPYIIKSKIHGVTHSNPDGVNRQDAIRAFVKSKQELILLPEKDNPVDPNALALYVNGKAGLFAKTKPYQLGYISADLSPQINDEIKAGHKIFVDVLEVTGTGKDHRGVNIKITIA